MYAGVHALKGSLGEPKKKERYAGLIISIWKLLIVNHTVINLCRFQIAGKSVHMMKCYWKLGWLWWCHFIWTIIKFFLKWHLSLGVISSYCMWTFRGQKFLPLRKLVNLKKVTVIIFCQTESDPPLHPSLSLSDVFFLTSHFSASFPGVSGYSIAAEKSYQWAKKETVALNTRYLLVQVSTEHLTWNFCILLILLMLKLAERMSVFSPVAVYLFKIVI